MEIREYPNQNEIFDFFSDFIFYDDLRDYFKKNGMIFATNKQSDIAEYASKIIYGYDDFEMIKSITSTKQRFNKITGFQIKTDKSIEEIRSSFESGKVIHTRNKLTIKNTTFARETEKIQVSYSFERKTPGRMNLINAEERKGDFLIEKKEGSTTRIVLFNHSKNEDYNAVRDIISSIKDEDDESFFEIIPMTLEKLPVSKRIEFIDQILQRGYANWSLSEVILIRVKKVMDLPEESSEEVASNGNEIVDRSDLEGINDAILRGHNLRENSFVKKCERSGFYFPSIIMKLAHESEPYVIHLEIQFKFRPEMPEVNIDQSFKVENGQEIESELELEFRKSALNQFIHETLKIFNDIARID